MTNTQEWLRRLDGLTISRSRDKGPAPNKPLLVLALSDMYEEGRSKHSIEFKLRNVSSVLQELRVPFVVGYLPAANASNDLMEFVSAAFGRIAGLLESASLSMWG